MSTKINSIEEINIEWLTMVLRQAGIIYTANIKTINITPVNLSGFLSNTAKLEITYSLPENAPKTFILKESSKDHEIRKICQEYQFYQREVNFYQSIAEISKIRVPKCYYASMNPNNGKHLLLLEYLGFADAGNRSRGCDKNDAEIVVEKLSYFHAMWWETNNLANLSWLPDLSSIYEFASTPETFSKSWEIFKSKYRDIPKNIIVAGDKYSKNVIWVLEHLFQTAPRTLIHSDFHLDNIFFDRNKNIIEPIIIDWQLITRGKGITDVACLLGQNLDISVRRSCEKTIIDKYHNGLLKEGITNYSYKECVKDYKLSLIYHFFGLVFSIGAEDFTEAQEMVLLEKLVPRNIQAIEDSEAWKLIK